MNYWPAGMKIDPIGAWPGERTVRRQSSPFSATIGTTVSELQREMRAINAKDVRLQIDLPPGKFRQDGNPRADAVPTTPGLILTFTTKHGAQSFPCDSFTRWEDNLRAVVLSLEALRRVDRYGVTKHGEQYRGFLAIEGATAMPAGFATADAALEFLGKFTGVGAYELRLIDGAIGRALRRAQRETHPDHGGDTATFQRVTLAESKLREEGIL